MDRDQIEISAPFKLTSVKSILKTYCVFYLVLLQYKSIFKLIFPVCFSGDSDDHNVGLKKCRWVYSPRFVEDLIRPRCNVPVLAAVLSAMPDMPALATTPETMFKSRPALATKLPLLPVTYRPATRSTPVRVLFTLLAMCAVVLQNHTVIGSSVGSLFIYPAWHSSQT
jgi:hypothetical protein